jgi:hypothetical protein
MSDTSKFPFDSIPLDGAAGGTAVIDPPRPSFSRSVPDVSAIGLLPPTRKPVAVTVPELPPVPPADEPTSPNPMASTPPPKAGSVRGLLWDLVRPTRTKGAILAGGLSLVAGAYGLNLVTPPAPPPPSKRELVEVAQLTGPMPRVVDERRPPPSVGEERLTPAPVVVKEHTPAPLPVPTPVPFPVKNEPIVRAQAEEPVPAVVPIPVAPAAKEPPAAAPLPTPVPLPVEQPKAAPLPVPVVNEKPEQVKAEPVTPLPLPAPLKPEPVKPEPAAPLPVPVLVDIQEKKEPSPKPAEKTALPPVPGLDDKKAEIPPPKTAFTEVPPKAEALPLPSPVTPGPLPVPEVKVAPISDAKPITLPQPGTVLSEAKPDKPAEAIPVAKPIEVKPVAVEPKPLEVVPAAEKKPDPIPAPLLKEEKPAVVAVPAEGVKDPPAVGGPPPRKGFEVDVVKVRNTDTYTSISEAFYQSRKYASALRAFNGDADISRLQEVEVPPLFELQKLTGTPARDAEPTGRTVVPVRGSTPTEPPVRGPVLEPTGDAGETLDWAPQGKKRAVIKYEKYTTPKDGMTARDVAKAVYADENEWAKLIGPRGAKLRADDRLPRGTELTVPREELSWK